MNTPNERIYGLDAGVWHAAKDEVRFILRLAAHEQRLITYGEITAQMHSVRAHPGSYVFTAMLRQVCQEEEDAGHGSLCALVVQRASGRPGAGYFRSLEGCPGEHLDDCWRAECAWVWAYWKERDV